MDKNSCTPSRELLTYEKNIKNHDVRIMVIDEDKDVLLTLGLLLKECNFVVSVFQDPSKALQHFLFNSMNYDVIISEIYPPFSEKLEMLKRVRKINPEIMILVTTTTSIFEDFSGDNDFIPNSSAYLDIDGIIRKPIPQFELCRVIDKTLKKDFL